MFILFGFFTDTEGKFWFQGGLDSEGTVQKIYDNCEDDSSSLSLVFFNINTDPDELRECLRQEVSYGSSSSLVFSADEIINGAGFHDGYDIPTEFKEIIRDVQQQYITEAKEEILSPEFDFTTFGFSDTSISEFVENFDSRCQPEWRSIPYSRCEELIHDLIVRKQEELMYRCNKNQSYYTYYLPEYNPRDGDSHAAIAANRPPLAPEKMCPSNERPPSLR